jgi:hypothetical protein
MPSVGSAVSIASVAGAIVEAVAISVAGAVTLSVAITSVGSAVTGGGIVGFTSLGVLVGVGVGAHAAIVNPMSMIKDSVTNRFIRTPLWINAKCKCQL